MSSGIRILSILIFFSITTVYSQTASYYVVIGAFAKEENAQRYTDQALALNIPAVYSLSADKKFYYVFVRQSFDKQKAHQTLGSVREEGFTKAWLFYGLLENLSPSAYARKVSTEKQVSIIPDKEPVNEKAPETEIADTAPATTTIVPVTETPVVTESKDDVPAGKPFVFRLLNGITGNPVTGLVRLQETEKANQYRGYTSHEKVYLIPPNNKSGKWFVLCQVIGFKPFKKQLNYARPDQQKEITIGPDQEAIVPINLVRVKRGDYIEMDEVKFFSNSSILTPGSERELKELLAMLQENPDYRIRLHGHTNGDQGRDIIALGESQNLFATDPANQRIAGTAKQLSSLRAETVKTYLVTNGIESSRIDTRGEGGKQMIFDPKSTLASGNDRVEVEVTRH